MYTIGCKDLENDGTKLTLKLNQINDKGIVIKTIAYNTLTSLDTTGWLNQTITPLDAGKYNVEVKASWLKDDVKDYTLSIYSKKVIKLTDSTGV